MIRILGITLLLLCISNGLCSKDSLFNALTFEAKNTNTEALIVYKDSTIIFEYYFHETSKDKLFGLKSSTKSIVALAILGCIEDGYIESLDSRVCDYYPEWNVPLKKEITIRHILYMTSGIQKESNIYDVINQKDIIKYALNCDLSFKPGTIYEYSNNTINILSGIIQVTTGKTLVQYMAEKFYEPMGITNYSWSTDSSNLCYAHEGCNLLPIDFLKIGILVLNEGTFNGIRIINEVLIQELFKPSPVQNKLGLSWWIRTKESQYALKPLIREELLNIGVNHNALEKVDSICNYLSEHQDASIKYRIEIQSLAWRLIATLPENNIRTLFSNFEPKESFMQELNKGEAICYETRGYLGNYLIIVPSKRIVAVRMISETRFRNHEGIGKGRDNFYNFYQFITKIE